jgi:hypothetical protein
MFSDPRTGRKLVTAFVLARMSLLVLSGRASVNVTCLDHDEDGVDHRCTAGSRLEVVLVGSTDVGTASTRPADHPLELRRAPDLTASSTVLSQEDRAVGKRIGSASAIQATTTTLVVTGLIGLLGVGGAAAFLVHSITGPVRRAVRVLQVPAEARPGQRLRLTLRNELTDISRDSAGDGHLRPGWETAADARSLSLASDGPTVTSGAPSSGVEESPTSAGVVCAGVEQATDVPAVAAAVTEIAPEGSESRSVLPEIARVVREAQRLAHEAMIGREQPAQEAAKPADAMTPPSTPTARPVATARYAAARGRALGPTTALWHAVQLDRLVGAIGGTCETTVCGSLVRLTTEEAWPVAARDVCPACATLAH